MSEWPVLAHEGLRIRGNCNTFDCAIAQKKAIYFLVCTKQRGNALSHEEEAIKDEKMVKRNLYGYRNDKVESSGGKEGYGCGC